jgi:hypothetical protein
MRAQVNAILRIVLVVSVLLILASIWLFYISIRPPKIVSSITPRELNTPHERVSFTTADGLTLRGWFIPSAKRRTKPCQWIEQALTGNLERVNRSSEEIAVGSLVFVENAKSELGKQATQRDVDTLTEHMHCDSKAWFTTAI